MYVSTSLSQRTTWQECHIIHKNQKRFLWADFSISSPSRVTYIGTASSHTAFPSCPSRRNLQGATPGKCVSLKFQCCSISLSPVANPVGTNLCLEPSQAHCKTTTTAKQISKVSCTEELHRTKWVSATSVRLLRASTDKGENKIRCMRVLLNYFGFFKPAIIITEKRRFSEC